MTGGARRAAWATAFVGLAAYFTLAALLGRGEPATPPLDRRRPPRLAAAGPGRGRGGHGGRQRRQAAERTRAEEARRRAGEERMRIARELHDVLAHNISLINVQAGVALHLMDEQPGQSRTALVAIKQASNDALGELRSVLDVLRQGDEAEPRSPASGLAQLDSLVAGAAPPAWRCAPGSRARPAPAAGTDLAAFRIVQESLTNVTRHAGLAASATVRIGYGADELVVEVTDDGRGRPPARARSRPPADDQQTRPAGSPVGRPGRGLVGMRSRPALGGAQRPARGGFRVLARLPLDEAARDPEVIAGPAGRRRRAAGPGSGPCWTPRRGSRWSARPPTARRPRLACCGPTWC